MGYASQPPPLPLKAILGERSSSDRDQDALTWTCGGCEKVNLPRRGLIADYPVLLCDCGQESEVEFDFSLGNVMINDQTPVIQANVKTQIKDGCPISATGTSIEIMLKMSSILAGEHVEGKETIIDMDHLHMLYEDTLKLPEVNKDNKWDEETLVTLALIANTFGVKSDEDNRSKVHHLAGFERVKDNFNDIVSVLADGHPLTTGIITGKNFEKLKPGQIYKAPRDENLIDGKHSKSGHAIVLIGAGRRRNTNYYHFMNSRGKFFCMEKDGRYGFGMLRASDIRIQPVKFIRYKEEA